MTKRKGGEHLKKYHFPKGTSGNPLGGKLHNQELRAIKNLTLEEVVDMASILVKGKFQKLTEIVHDQEEINLRKWFATVILKGIAKGDMQTLNALLDRIVGKVPDKLEAQHMHLLHEIKQIADTKTHEEIWKEIIEIGPPKKNEEQE